MSIRDFLAPGTLALGLVALTAAQSNQVSIEKGKAQPAADPVPSSAPAAAAASGAGGAASFAAFGDRVAFAETGTLSLDRTSEGAYTSGFVVTNPECLAQVVSFSVQVFDRHHARLKVVPTFELVERDPVPKVPAGSPAAAPTQTRDIGGADKQWTLESGESAQFELTIGGASAVAHPSDFDDTFAVVFSLPMGNGYWSGHLPASGLFILTRHSPKASVEVKEVKETKDGKEQITRTSTCASGYAERPTRVARALALQPPLPSRLDAPVLLVSFFLALAATIVAAWRVWSKRTTSMPAVGFDIKSSWASSLNVGAGLLNGLMVVSILSPAQYSISSTTYVVLAALFAALVPVGSAVNGLIRPTTSNQTQPGSVNGFLTSSLIVLWGGFGQLLLLGMFLRELELARVLSPLSAVFLIVVTKIVGFGLFVYSIRAMKDTVDGGRREKQEPPPLPRTEGVESRDPKGVDDKQPPPPPPPPPPDRAPRAAMI